jgi:hypothetical protein
MGVLLDFYPALRERGRAGEWFGYLGEEWEVCDNIGLYLKKLRPILGRHPRLWGRLMSPSERISYLALPYPVLLFRGAGPLNRLGLSWATSREVATKFLSYDRYRQERPLLLVGRFCRGQVVAVKEGRGEQEVIVLAEDKNIVQEEEIRPASG